jgi:hypothetical protein
MCNWLRIAASAGVLGLAAMPALAEGSEIYFGVEGALLQSSGDPFQGFGNAGFTSANVGPSPNVVEPEDGWGGRLWVQGPLPLGGENGDLMFRGSLNGGWLSGNDREVFNSGSFGSEFEQEAELDAFWATLEAFCTWVFGRPLRPHTMVGLGGGIEFADVENTFEESLVSFDSESTFSQRLRQETTFWGVGPRVSGFVDHELGQSGVHIVAEAGAAYLAGGRDTEIKEDFNGEAFREKDSSTSNVLHTNVRFGVGYGMELGGLDFRFDVGWRQDSFNNANNTLFLPEDNDGDSVFSGPFVAAGFGIPLN